MTVAPLFTKPPRKNPQPAKPKNNLKQLPRPNEQLSSRLQFLLFIQKSVSIVTFCLVGTTLGLYAWTVYFPKIWSGEYQKLETLQRYERHILSTNESLKNRLAQQAEKPETGLSNPSPTQSIFLKPTSDPTSEHSPSQPQQRISSVAGTPPLQDGSPGDRPAAVNSEAVPKARLTQAY
jgi:hypothetical protein